MIEMGMTWKGVPLTRASEALRNEYSMHHMWRFVRLSDYGAAAYMTYTTDLCRTWPVSGRFTAEQRKYYDIVLEAQEAAIGAIRRGVAMLASSRRRRECSSATGSRGTRTALARPAAR